MPTDLPVWFPPPHQSPFCFVHIFARVWSNSQWPTPQGRMNLSPPALTPEAISWGGKTLWPHTTACTTVLWAGEGQFFQMCRVSSSVPMALFQQLCGWGCHQGAGLPFLCHPLSLLKPVFILTIQYLQRPHRSFVISFVCHFGFELVKICWKIS